MPYKAHVGISSIRDVTFIYIFENFQIEWRVVVSLLAATKCISFMYVFYFLKKYFVLPYTEEFTQ